jgi:hypothetical protein
MSDEPQPPTHPAVEQLRQAFRAVDLPDLDPLTTPWKDLEPAIARLLGGPFSASQPQHGGVATLLAAAFGERVCRQLGGFWFPNRSAPGGAAVGFPFAMMTFSPVEIVVQALARASLPMLDDIARDLAGTLERARGETAAAGAPRLGPEDYQRLFDPGFVQFCCVEHSKVRKALARTPAEAAREIDDALGRLPPAVPAQVRASVRDQIVGALSAMPPTGPLSARATEAAPLVELVGLLEGATEATRFAPAELWQHVLLPLLHIGPAETFPPLDDEDRGALRDGNDPLIVYVETLPFRTPAADEDGVLGVFPGDQLGALDASLAAVASPRVVVVPVAPIAAVVSAFDRTALRQAVERFTRHAVAETQGAGESAPNVESQLLPVALDLLAELSRVVQAVNEAPGGERALVIRRAPEAEAAADATLQELRKAMQGSRIILI